MVQIDELKAGNYSFTGVERCDSGFSYNATINIHLQTDKIVKGTVTFSSAQGTQDCPIIGSWKDDGTIQYTLSYLEHSYSYEGHMRENIGAGLFWLNATGDDTFESSPFGNTARGIYRHVLVNTEDNPSLLAKYSVGENWKPIIATASNAVAPGTKQPNPKIEKYREKLQKIWSSGEYAPLQPGIYHFSGTEVCETGFTYESELTLQLYENKSVSGSVKYSSNEGVRVETITGSWEANNKVIYELSYSGNIYAFQCALIDNSLEGYFWLQASASSTFEDVGTNARGFVTHKLRVPGDDTHEQQVAACKLM